MTIKKGKYYTVDQNDIPKIMGCGDLKVELRTGKPLLCTEADDGRYCFNGTQGFLLNSERVYFKEYVTSWKERYGRKQK
jgi:hypothetical protein